MSKRLQLTFFGAPTLTYDNQRLTGLLTGKALALFIYLAVTGRVHNRDLLADLLWSELSNQQARNNLRYLLPDLRQVVDTYLLITPQTIGFNRQAAYWLDVEVLRTTLTADIARVDTDTMQAALDLYRAEFLLGFRVRNAPSFEAWVAAQQAELHTLAVQGWQQLTARYLDENKVMAGLAAAQRLLAIEPWHEAGHRLYMQLLVANGQRATALENYQQLQKLLCDEAGVTPTTETTTLYEQIRRGEFAAPASMAQPTQTPTVIEHLGKQSVRPSQPPMVPTAQELSPHSPFRSLLKHNLPRPMTPFVGRQIEMAAVRTKLLEPAYPLLSLVGEGGMGKTRLALAVAQSIADSATPPTANLQSPLRHSKFPDGVWFVPLGAIPATDDPLTRIAAAIGAALDLAFAGSEPLVQQLFAQLRHKHLLLILDNFEHLVDQSAFVLDLLQAAPGVKVLITSRRRLELQAEYAWLLDGLTFLSEGEAEDAPDHTLLDYESIGLFVERARRSRPNFQFDTENRAAIVRICQLVEGSPLAVELAATLVNQRSCEQIAASLAENYTILTTTLRDMPAHHRSMRSVLDYSWQLLTAAEARVAGRCSSFVGGFTLDAAYQVANATPDVIDRLVRHSLLYANRDLAGQTRYTMHDLVRHYAAEQLQRSPTIAWQTAEQHCTYYANLLYTQTMALKQTARARHVVHADLENARTAWQWAVAQARIDALGQSLATLNAFYEFAGFFHEAKEAFEQASQKIRLLLTQPHPQPAALQLLLGRLLVEQAGFCVHLAQLDQACQIAQQVIQIGKQLNNRYLMSSGHRRLGAAQCDLGDMMSATTNLETGLALARNDHQPTAIALCLHNLAMILYNQGEYQKALDYNQEALALAQQSGDKMVESPIAHNLGLTYLMLSDFSQALLYLQQNIQTSRELGWQRLLAFANMNLGYLLMLLGDLARAQQVLEEALVIFTNLSCRCEQASVLSQLGIIFRLLDDTEKAYIFCSQALEITETDNHPWQRGVALIDLGDTLVAMRRWREAHYLYEQALTIWQTLENAGQVTLVLAALAWVELQQQNVAQAQRLVAQILPDLSTVSADGARIFLICYQVLTALHDPRAHAVLQQGYAFVQAQSATLRDENLQRSFLTQVAVNRELLALARQAGIAP